LQPSSVSKRLERHHSRYFKMYCRQHALSLIAPCGHWGPHIRSCVPLSSSSSWLISPFKLKSLKPFLPLPRIKRQGAAMGGPMERGHSPFLLLTYFLWSSQQTADCPRTVPESCPISLAPWFTVEKYTV